MTAAFAFFASGSDAADSNPADGVPHALYRSEAFAEDLDLMPAPQAVRRPALSRGAPPGRAVGRWTGWLAAPGLAVASSAA